MVGGKPDQVEEWRSYADGLGLGDSVHFLGTVSLAESLQFLELAAVLVSPRTGGTSVPLKIYSYLHAGKPIVATKLPAHTQLLDDEVAILAEPNARAYASAIERALADAELAQRLGRQAKAYAEREFTRSNYVNRLQMAYLAIKHARPIAEQKPLSRQHAVTRN
jgi:glycosyltransferase involved in cell wall biosynthesis